VLVSFANLWTDNKFLVIIGDMQNIMKIKMDRRGKETAFADMVNRQPLTIADLDTIDSCVIYSRYVEVCQVRG
jgi:hypothetical protein